MLDTPPSRNALDFLDAPDRLTGFLEGRALRVFLRPDGAGGEGRRPRHERRLLACSSGVTGVDLLDDLSVFFRALGGLLDGFRERAAGVKALLADDATTFMIVTSPEREPVEEAIFFRGKLREAGMPFGGLVVNRVHPLAAGRPRPTSSALAAALGGDAELAAQGRATPMPSARARRSATAPRSSTCARDRRAATRSSSPSSTATSTTSTGWWRSTRHLFAD